MPSRDACWFLDARAEWLPWPVHTAASNIMDHADRDEVAEMANAPTRVFVGLTIYRRAEEDDPCD